jgi:hypothetical protein
VTHRSEETIRFAGRRKTADGVATTELRRALVYATGRRGTMSFAVSTCTVSPR